MLCILAITSFCPLVKPIIWLLHFYSCKRWLNGWFALKCIMGIHSPRTTIISHYRSFIWWMTSNSLRLISIFMPPTFQKKSLYYCIVDFNLRDAIPLCINSYTFMWNEMKKLWVVFPLLVLRFQFSTVFVSSTFL